MTLTRNNAFELVGRRYGKRFKYQHKCNYCGRLFFAVKRYGVRTCSPKCRQRVKRHPTLF